jgi:hypothetical protein
MFNTWPLLKDIPFPAIRRGRLDTLQINVGYRCNQYCVHCHVGGAPHRREQMNAQTIDLVLAVLEPAPSAHSTSPAGRPNSIRISADSFVPRASSRPRARSL